MYTFLRFVLIFFFLAVIALYFAYADIFTFESVKLSSQHLQTYVEHNYMYSVLFYIGLYSICVLFALPLASILTITGGFLFGTVYGALFAGIGATLGATLCFLAVRYVIGDSIQKRFKKQLAALNSELNTRGAYYLLSLRLFAIIPFFILNLLAGLTKITIRTFIVTTILGIIPATCVYAYAGQSLTTLASPSAILTPKILIAFALLGALALVPIVIQQWFYTQELR